jgi:hypothetical protein
MMRAGLATATPQRIRAGGKVMEVATRRITDEGWNAVAACCAAATTRPLFPKAGRRARFWPYAEKILARARFRGMAMSELIVLVSCGAAFVTGLVIAGLSLIG